MPRAVLRPRSSNAFAHSSCTNARNPRKVSLPVKGVQSAMALPTLGAFASIDGLSCAQGSKPCGRTPTSRHSKQCLPTRASFALLEAPIQLLDACGDARLPELLME